MSDKGRCGARHYHWMTFVCTKPIGHFGDHGYAGNFWPDNEADWKPFPYRDGDIVSEW